MYLAKNDNSFSKCAPKRSIIQLVFDMCRAWTKIKPKKEMPITEDDLRYLSPHMQRDLGLDRTGLPKRRT